MHTYTGQISKLRTNFNNPIEYSLPIGDDIIPLNNLIGKQVTLNFNHEIRCIKCNAQIKKTFMQGYCYPCFISSPQTSECILKPELCKAHLGEARDMDWAKKYCLEDQYVYLSLTSNLKVGVTRHTQIPTRWIDQGAHKALVFAKTPNRYTAGILEKDLSQHISDRTYWRRMLMGEYPDIDLVTEKNKLKKIVNPSLQQYITTDNKETQLIYPKIQEPEKIKSLNFDKSSMFSGKLNGIKGQYLFLNTDSVINVRKFTGYNITIKIDD